MKDFWKDWRFWTVFGIVAALVIAAVVLHLKQPTVSFAFLEMVSTATFVLGGVVGAIVYAKWNERKLAKANKK